MIDALRILFVSGFFPPHAPIGAVRPGKLEQHWRACGHKVRVIAVALPSQRSVHGEFSAASVSYLDYREPGRLITNVASRFKRLGRSASAPVPGSEMSASALHAVAQKPGTTEFYRQALFLPDRFRSWIRPAVRLGRSWRFWQPHVVYSSGPPHSGHIVAAALAKRLACPWIAEFRDLWADNPYQDLNRVIKPIYDRQAWGTLKHATAFVAVTQQARDRLAAVTRKRVVLSYNGYDPEEFDSADQVEPFDRHRLTVLHAGYIYRGRRDPTPLFRAMEALGKQKQKIRCLFYGETTGTVAALAERCGVAECVEIYDAVSRPEILRLERQMDVLLECHWNDPAGDGVIPGKLFEYIGARRPILCLGSETGEAATIVRDNSFGLASTDPDAIRSQLINWLHAKAQFGRVPDLDSQADIRFQRKTQFHKIDELIADVVSSSAGERK